MGTAAPSTTNFREESNANVNASVDYESGERVFKIHEEEIEEQEKNVLLAYDTNPIDDKKPQVINSEKNNEEPRIELNNNTDTSVESEEEEKITLLYDEDINETDDEIVIDENNVTSSNMNNEETATNMKAIDIDEQAKNSLLEEDEKCKNRGGQLIDGEDLDDEA